MKMIPFPEQGDPVVGGGFVVVDEDMNFVVIGGSGDGSEFQVTIEEESHEHVCDVSVSWDEEKLGWRIVS